MSERFTQGVSLRKCMEELNLEVISGEEYLDRKVYRPMLSRPGVEIYSDYFNYYEKDRIQVIGSKEFVMFQMLPENEKEQRVDKLFSYDPPAFIFTKNVPAVPHEFIEASLKYKIPIFRSKFKTTPLIGKLSSFLIDEISERKTMHGVMMDVYGVGVLITGKSFVGKSETALELLKRGHILVADDRVDVSQREVGTLVAHTPEITKGLIEVRGIGIVDVIKMFGVTSFRNKKTISLVIELVNWEEKFDHNRLMLEDEYTQIFDTMLPKVSIPVKPGRNLATLIEVACMNYLAKKEGYNAGVEFAKRVDELVKKGGNQ
ncbi:MAG: HPr(Ser) kinase/phosphatase [Acholeplasmataceae bacterium]|nr:HPr(Ser) kinase/phosphatase [Acholeplasmataceae bacterium]